jgi:hypothetical protein
MGRSYSEHPFHEQQPMLGVQGSGPRLGNDEDQQKLGQQKPTLPDMPGGYRQPHAETIKRYQRRAARKAAGESGGRTAAKKAAPAAKKAAPVKKAAPAAKKAAPMKAAPMTKKAAPAAKPAAKPAAAKKKGGLVALATARGGKTVSRMAAAAKTVVSRVAKKAGVRKSPKTR